MLFLVEEGKPEGRTRMDVVVGWWVLCEERADSDVVPWCAFVVKVPVGICTCPSESCVAPAPPAEDEEEEEEEDPTLGFDIPNCVEY